MTDPARLVDQIMLVAQEEPSRELVVDANDRLTYGQAARAIIELAAALRRAGVMGGERIAYLGVPRPGFLLSMAATHLAGAVWMGLNPRYTVGELAYVIGDAKPSLIIVEADADDDVVGKVQAAMASVEAAAALQVVDHWSELTSLAGTIAAPIERLADDTALIVYTSGTTGKPKGACLSHRGVMEAARLYGRRYAHPNLRSLLNLPINHVGALVDLTASAIFMRGTLVAMPTFDPVAIPEVMRRERISILGQVPTMHLMIEALAGFDSANFPHLKHIVWSGASMPLAWVERHFGKGPQLSTCYGQTECTGAVTFTGPNATVGQLAEGVGAPAEPGLVKIVDTEGAEVAHGEAGEVLICGALLMTGYYNQPETTSATITTDGWLCTGDLGRFNDNGDLVLVGRLREMYKSGGYNVYPREIEVVLEDHPLVEAAAVIAMPDAQWQEVGWGFVMASGNVAEDEIRSFARERLANFKLPKRIIIRNELPLLPIGKIDKRLLRDQASSGAYD
jgi:acyl-CoA synthetase (AMP-forming)/AMP-acid ligase II